MSGPADILQINVRATRAPSRAIGVVFAGVLLVFAWPGHGLAKSPPPAPSSSAQSPQVPETQVRQLAALLVQMFPIGTIMDDMAARDSKWPLDSRADRVTPDQLACMRNGMSSAGWQQLKLSQAREYVAAHPGSIAGDLRILRTGVASVFGRVVQAGLLAQENGTPFDRKAALASVSAKQMHAIASFSKDPEYAPLRELVGIGESLNASMEGNQHAGYAKGASIVLDLMFHTMDDCKIPPATLM